MSVTALEGVVEKGRIRLKSDVRLPDNMTVYVLIPQAESNEVARFYSPRLAEPAQARDFVMEVIEDPLDDPKNQ